MFSRTDLIYKLAPIIKNIKKMDFYPPLGFNGDNELMEVLITLMRVKFYMIYSPSVG